MDFTKMSKESLKEMREQIDEAIEGKKELRDVTQELKVEVEKGWGVPERYFLKFLHYGKQVARQNTAMGKGSEIVIEDEDYILDLDSESKHFRILKQEE